MADRSGSASNWTAADIPGLDGQIAVVTGANSGLGLVCAAELARAGATVVLACRDVARGQRAAGGLRDGETVVEQLDLADLASVRAFADRFKASFERLDLLICNAGVMAPPRQLTRDGFESQFGINHLGHFALTGLLAPALLAAPGARVVSVSSEAHRIGRIKWDDLQREHGYNRWTAYGQSKLANLLFCFELARRCAAARVALISAAAHPGYAATNLQSSGPRGLEAAVMRVTNALLAQSAEMGALPSLYAATAPDVGGGDYFGPDGPGGARGYPHHVSASARARDAESQRRLWEISERLTGVRYELG
jgi:NAD(P)-dependent dehydrogenase (short-subunit alcohol dehydrogenase family)